MNNKIDTKDLINIGIFTAIYFLISLVCAMIGFIPIVYLCFPLIIPIIMGIPCMLFLTKIKKFGMITLMGLILGLLMFIWGNTWIPILFGLGFGFFADIILKLGHYKSFKNSAIACAVFNMWTVGVLLPFWIIGNSYIKFVASSMGKDYVISFTSLMTWWLPFVLLVASFISGLIGAYIGKKTVEKHFKRANIL